MFIFKFWFQPKYRPPVTVLHQPKKTDIPPDEVTQLQNIYDAVCKNLDRETLLLNFRISWAIALSGGIIVTQGYILSYVTSHFALRPSILLLGQAGLVALSVIAANFCYISARGVVAQQSQTSELKEAYERYAPLFETLGLPRPFGDKETHDTGDYNAITFPVALMYIWIGLALVQFAKVVVQAVTLSEDTTLRVCLKSVGECLKRMTP